MTFNTKLVPWKWGKKNVPVRTEDSRPEYSPFLSLQKEINRAFDDFFGSFETGLKAPLPRHQHFLCMSM